MYALDADENTGLAKNIQQIILGGVVQERN